LTAVRCRPAELQQAGEELLEDESFAVQARQGFYFFKITSLSGQSCILVEARLSYGVLLRRACERLGMPRSGDESLLFGTELVPENNHVEEWPGRPAKGRLVEYQLIKSKRLRAE